MSTHLTNTEQKEFHKAAIEGNLDWVRSILEREPDVSIQDHTQFTPLMHAASHGHIDIVCELLTPCLRHVEATWLIQHAFEAAAEKAQVETARLLVDIGADPDWAFIGMQDYWERCPICYHRCCPGARNVCVHWICGSDNLGFTWFRHDELAFDNDVDELVSRVNLLVELESHRELLETAPPIIRAVLDRALELGRFYWASDSRVAVTEWHSRGPVLDHGQHFYSSNPDLAYEVSEQASVAIAWLDRHGC